MQKVKLSDSLTLGFALFAMFFGAGNLIFPPFLGFMSGGNWFIGFLCFIAADAGLSLLALFVIARIGHGVEGITEVLGSGASKLFLALSCLCIGPFIAIPRTGAITYEVGVSPLIGGSHSIAVTGIFFLICLFFSIRRAQIIDVIGKVLSPLMFMALMVLVIKGIMDPIGTIGLGDAMPHVVKNGIISGYQTMDMMGSAVFSMAIVFEITNRGYRSETSQFKIIVSSGTVCGLLLFIVYGGLAWLGASAGDIYPDDITQTELLTDITRTILGAPGLYVLACIVAIACMTTAVGLLTSVSSFFTDLTHGKISYEVFVIVFSLFSWVISNFGISTIISIAAPILTIMFPVLIVLTFLRLFASRIKDRYVYILSSCTALIISFMSTLSSLTGIPLGTDKLPLFDMGFEWVIPSLMVTAITLIISKYRHTKSS